MIRKQRNKTTPHRLRIFCIGMLLCISTTSHADDRDYRELVWQDLLAHTPPAAELPGKKISARARGNASDELADPTGDTVMQNLNAQALEAQQAAIKGRVDIDGLKIKIAGYIIPLEDSPEGAITEFFLVPYVGACIHVPPPPPDQIVYVKFPHGIKIENIYDAYSVQGTLHTQASHSGLAQTAYTLTADAVGIYDGREK